MGLGMEAGSDLGQIGVVSSRVLKTRASPANPFSGLPLPRVPNKKPGTYLLGVTRMEGITGVQPTAISLALCPFCIYPLKPSTDQ